MVHRSYAIKVRELKTIKRIVSFSRNKLDLNKTLTSTLFIDDDGESRITASLSIIVIDISTLSLSEVSIKRSTRTTSILHQLSCPGINHCRSSGVAAPDASQPTTRK